MVEILLTSSAASSYSEEFTQILEDGLYNVFLPTFLKMLIPVLVILFILLFIRLGLEKLAKSINRKLRKAKKR